MALRIARKRPANILLLHGAGDVARPRFDQQPSDIGKPSLGATDRVGCQVRVEEAVADVVTFESWLVMVARLVRWWIDHGQEVGTPHAAGVHGENLEAIVPGAPAGDDRHAPDLDAGLRLDVRGPGDPLLAVI